MSDDDLQYLFISPHIQFHLVPVVRDLAQFPFFTADQDYGSAQLIQTLLDSLILAAHGIYICMVLIAHLFLVFVFSWNMIV